MASPKHVWVLIPAAGESQRFRDAGYPTPKPLLRVAHNSVNRGIALPMISHVARSVGGAGWPILAALPEKEVDAGSPRLAAAIEASGGRIHTMGLPKTKGQADSIRQMIRWLPRRHVEETAVLIVNCDVVFRDPSRMAWLVERVLTGFSVSMLTMDSENPAMSYASPYPCPQKFAEKDRISRHAMAGAWAFSSASRLLTALDWACCQGRREPYLSHAIGRIRGGKIAQEVQESEILDWGTPKLLRQSGAVIVGS